jgi:foldase protein PrsA
MAGCGGAADHTTAAQHDPPPGPKGSAAALTAAVRVQRPNAVVARVGTQTLTAAMLQHLVALEEVTEAPAAQTVLDPPSFKECVARMAASSHRVAATNRKETCQKLYQRTREVAERRWISAQWSMRGAEEIGIHVSDRAVRARFEESLRAEHKSIGEFAKSLAANGETEADVLEGMRVTSAQEQIRAAIERRARAVPPGEVARYYKEHLATFAVPERRDLNIIRAKTRAAAEKIKREIASGRTFASEAKASRLTQPIFSFHGAVRGLKPGDYSQSSLDEAIFHAKRNALSGPVGISLGWYVFEVKAIHRGRQKPLAEVARAIRHLLPELREQHDLVAFTTRWHARWRPRTSCSPGYVVQRCKQYKPPHGAAEEDPYSVA